MNVILYSTHCPKCTILEKKLLNANIDFHTVTDVEIIKNKGYMSVPVLEVDGEVMDFGSAIKWANSIGDK